MKRNRTLRRDEENDRVLRKFASPCLSTGSSWWADSSCLRGPRTPAEAHAEPGPTPNCWPEESGANKMMVVSSHYVWGLVCYPAQANWKRHLSPADVSSFCLPKLHESMDCLFLPVLYLQHLEESVVFLCWINMPYIWTEERMYFLVLKNEILDLLVEKALVL